MGLPWVRLDANIANHDKILHLLMDPSPKRFQAAASYMFAIAWSGGNETDGDIPRVALPFVHGTPATARLLEKYALWDETPTGWRIRNYARRQSLAESQAAKKTAQSAGAIKANCRRFHGEHCGCWQESLTRVSQPVSQLTPIPRRSTESHGRTDERTDEDRRTLR